jgi:hypothetical protein
MDTNHKKRKNRMKVNLLYGNGQILQNCLNINPFLEEEQDNLRRGDIKNLDKFVDDGEVDELIVTNVLEYFQPNKVVEILNHWLKKLAINGKIIIGFTDCYFVCKKLINFEITLAEFNDLIHGAQNKPNEYRRGSISMANVINFFNSVGYKILQKRIDGDNYIITAQRIK